MLESTENGRNGYSSQLGTLKDILATYKEHSQEHTKRSLPNRGWIRVYSQCSESSLVPGGIAKKLSFQTFSSHDAVVTERLHVNSVGLSVYDILWEKQLKLLA